MVAGSSTISARGAQVVFDQNGNGMAVWQLDTDLFYSLYSKSSDTWSAVQVLDGTLTGFVQTPHLSMSANGNALVTWQQNGIFYARRYIAGSWDGATTIPVLLSGPGSAVNSVGAINDNGRAVVAIIQSPNFGTNNLYVNVYNGTTWQASATALTIWSRRTTTTSRRIFRASPSIRSTTPRCCGRRKQARRLSTACSPSSRYGIDRHVVHTQRHVAREHDDGRHLDEHRFRRQRQRSYRLAARGSLIAKSYTRSTNARGSAAAHAGVRELLAPVDEHQRQRPGDLGQCQQHPGAALFGGRLRVRTRRWRTCRGSQAIQWARSTTRVRRPWSMCRPTQAE